MRSNAGMDNRQGTSTCASRKSPPPVTLWLGFFGQRISHSFTQHRHSARRHINKKASIKPQQYQEEPVCSLHIKTDSQSVSGGVIWSPTAKGVGLSVPVQKGVTRSLDTWQHHHNTERGPVVAAPANVQFPGLAGPSSSTAVLSRSHAASTSASHRVDHGDSRPNSAAFCLCSTCAGTLQIPVQTLISESRHNYSNIALWHYTLQLYDRLNK